MCILKNFKIICMQISLIFSIYPHKPFPYFSNCVEMKTMWIIEGTGMQIYSCITDMYEVLWEQKWKQHPNLPRRETSEEPDLM